MKTVDSYMREWSETYANPPKLEGQKMIVATVLAIVLLVMAILQVASFTQFKDALTGLGLTAATGTWAVIIVLAELWAALGFVSIRMPGLLRFFGGVFAVLASGFWFTESLQIVSSGADKALTNMGFFGRFLSQTPGWWTVIEASVLLFWVVKALKLSKKQ